MFCSNCGNELREGLKYCNRCGVQTNAELEKLEASSGSKKVAQGLTIATGWVGFGGVVGLAILIGNLLRREFIPREAVVIVLIFAALVFGIVFLLIRLISNLTNQASPQNLPTQKFQNEEPESYLPPPQTARLNSPIFQPASSVTENTTRDFEQIYAEKRES